MRKLLLIPLALLAGCSHSRPASHPMPLPDAMHLIDSRADWSTLPPINIPRHPAEKFLKDLTIVIDPGHGGSDGGDATTHPSAYKAGPTGVKEAHMNLRVALLLERLLQDAGTNVILTRHGDESLSLTQRAEIANTAKRPDGAIGADLFISIHHNATSGSKTNFTSVWYHGQVDDAEVALDLGRHVAAELGKAMRTDVALTSPLFSDQLMYGTGFGVLRACNVPGILCECSFYTNPSEEQRLRDASYNLREAYAIYLGLCEYAYEGRPTQSLPQVTIERDTIKIITTLSDGLPDWWGKDRTRILRSSISVTWNDRPRLTTYDPYTKTLRATGPFTPPTTQSMLTTAPAESVLRIHFANMFSNHNWPQRFLVHPREVNSNNWFVDPTRMPKARPDFDPRQRPRPPSSRPSTTRASGG